MQKLIPCKKPAQLDEQRVCAEVEVGGHRVKGHYDLAGNYYEHDLCCGRWFKLSEVEPEGKKAK